MTSVLYDCANIVELIHSDQVTPASAMMLANLLYYSLSFTAGNACQPGPFQGTFLRIKKLSMSCLTLPKMRTMLTMHSNNAAMVAALLKSFLLVLCQSHQAEQDIDPVSDNKLEASAELGQVDSSNIGGNSMLIGNEQDREGTGAELMDLLRGFVSKSYESSEPSEDGKSTASTISKLSMAILVRLKLIYPLLAQSCDEAIRELLDRQWELFKKLSDNVNGD